MNRALALLCALTLLAWPCRAQDSSADPDHDALEALPGPAQTPPPTPTPAPREDAFQRDLEKTLQKAQQAQDETQKQASYVLDMMDVFLSFLAVLLSIVGVIVAVIVGVLSFLGFSEWKKVHELAKKAVEANTNAEKTAQRLTDAAAKAEQGAERIIAWSIDLSKAWPEIEASLQELPELGFEVIEGMEPEGPTLPVGISARAFEDADIVLMLCDQLKIPAERDKIGRLFIKLVKFWVIMSDPRALARAERAVKLTPQDADAHRYLAWTLANWADGLPLDSSQRQEALLRALTELDEVKKLQQGKDNSLSLFVRAFTVETQREFAQAAAIYKEAREEDRKEAAQNGREEDSRITYNRACSLANAGELKESLEEVALFLRTWPARWQAVTNGPDFQTLRSTSPWQEQLAILVEDAKRRAPTG